MRNNTLTVEDLVQWILTNRRGYVFKDWPEQEIRHHLLECLNENRLFVDTDKETGAIIGMLTGEKIFHVQNMLTTRKDSFHTLLESIYTAFPFFKFKAWRSSKSKEVIYNGRPKHIVGLSAAIR